VSGYFRDPALPVLLLLLACRAGEAEPDESHLANVPELVAEEVLRVGSVDDPDAGFTRIGGIAVDGHGMVHVLESHDRQIRVYDEDGSHVRTFGRAGEGPGEFRSARLIGLRHDTLVVGDAGLGRITFFDRSGAVLGTLSVPPVWLTPVPGVMMMVEPAGFRHDGFATTVTRVIMPPEPPRDSFAVPRVVVDRSGRVADTLGFDRWGLSTPRVRVGNVEVQVPSPPTATPLQVAGERDTYVVDRPVATAGDRAAFTVTRLGHSGDTIYQRVIRYRPASFPAAFIDTTVARAVRPYLRNQGADSQAIESAIRRALSLPPYQPPVTQGRVGADGVLWLQLHDDGTDQHRWLLIDPEGRIRGAAGIPRNVTVHWSSGESAWAAARDAFDVPWLVRYRVRPAAQ
jgi:hypothetical protein